MFQKDHPGYTAEIRVQKVKDGSRERDLRDSCNSPGEKQWVLRFGCEMQFDFGNNSKVEPIRFEDGLDVKYEKKEEFKNTAFLCLTTRMNGFAIFLDKKEYSSISPNKKEEDTEIIQREVKALNQGNSKRNGEKQMT